MNQIKKLSGRFLILLYTVTLVSCIERPEAVQEKTERIIGIKSNYLASGKAIGGTNYYTITRNDGRGVGGSSMILETIPSIYAIDMQLSDTKKDLGINNEYNEIVSQSHMDEFLINLYDLDSNTLIKTIDVKKIIEQEERRIQLTNIGSFETRSINGMPYLGFLVEDYPEKFEEGIDSTRIMYWINLEKEETLESEEEEWSRKFPMDDKMKVFQDYSFVQNNFSSDEFDIRSGFDVLNMKYWEGCCYIDMRLELLPQKNTKLYSMFPKLKEQVEEIKKQDGEHWIKIYLTGNPTPTEIMELCLPEGQEVVFEEMILPAESTIDGKEHTVRSLEEYEKYIKLEDGDETGVNPIFENRP